MKWVNSGVFDFGVGLSWSNGSGFGLLAVVLICLMAQSLNSPNWCYFPSSFLEDTVVFAISSGPSLWSLLFCDLRISQGWVVSGVFGLGVGRFWSSAGGFGLLAVGLSCVMVQLLNSPNWGYFPSSVLTGTSPLHSLPPPLLDTWVLKVRTF